MKNATLGQGAKVLQMIINKETANEHLQWMLESGALPDLLDANPEGFDRAAYRKLLGLKPLNPPFLIHVGRVVTVPATTTPFIARDRFVPNVTRDASVQISYIKGTFKAWFLGKEEPPFGGSTLRRSTLSRSYAYDDHIIVELGGEEKAETTLTELFSLMAGQKNGKSGPLLTNGKANIFYVRDVSGVFRTVYVSLDNHGWRVLADAFTSQDLWSCGCQVFSRDSH